MRALVESPLQLLSAVEAHAAGYAGTRTRIVVRPAAAGGLPRAARAVAALGLPDGVDLTSGNTRPIVPRGSDGVLVGDAFSGRAQAAVVRDLPGRVVLVDAGLTTVDLARRLVGGEPLTRTGAPAGPTRTLLGTLAGRRLRRVASEGRLTLCTAFPLDDGLRIALRGIGVDVVAHSFPWLASRPPADAPAEPVVVVGSALAADRLVAPDRYVAWVRGLASDGPVRYLPHRRHDPFVTAVLRTVPGLVVDAPDVPPEVRLRGLAAGQRVVSLPSTAAVTLTRLLAPRGVTVTPHAVPEDWWTPRATPALHRHLEAALRLAHRALAVDGPPAPRLRGAPKAGSLR